MTAGRRRCVLSLAFAPAIGRKTPGNVPASLNNTSTGRKTGKTLPAHPQNAVQGRKTPGNVPVHLQTTGPCRETGLLGHRRLACKPTPLLPTACLQAAVASPACSLRFHPHFRAFLRVKLKPHNVSPAFLRHFAGENACIPAIVQIVWVQGESASANLARDNPPPRILHVTIRS